MCHMLRIVRVMLLHALAVMSALPTICNVLCLLRDTHYSGPHCELQSVSVRLSVCVSVQLRSHEP